MLLIITTSFFACLFSLLIRLFICDMILITVLVEAYGFWELQESGDEVLTAVSASACISAALTRLNPKPLVSPDLKL